MTIRELYTAVINGNITEEVKAKATEALAKLDESNAKRKSKPSKKTEENAPIKVAIAAVLSDEYELTSQIADKVEEYDLSVSKCGALLRQMVAEGTADVCEVKVSGVGPRKAYKRVSA